MRSLVEAHDRVKDFDWTATYAEQPVRYPTKYKIPKTTKDPFRHLIRDYVKMEREKDDRQYGALEDVLARSNAPAKVERRWMEIMKPAIPIINFGEYAAMKSCGQLIDTVDNSELRQGYLAQMLDEVRHTNQEMYLTRYYAKHAAEPDGFAHSMKIKGTNMFNRAGRAALENFFVGDPIEGALNLQVVAETAYTNPIFVAMTEVAALQGDQATPSVFLSIQSDEARHMSNGYSTLAAVVSNPDNLPALQADFDRAFWRQHAFLDPFMGVVYDYFQTNRSTSYLEKWNEWIGNDWAGSYIAKLEPFGLKAPRWFDEAQERMKWVGHSAAMIAAAAWPLQYWRTDPLNDADFEWFENKYPGWYDNFGFFWEGYRELTDPKDGGNTLALFETLPPLCRVCQMPTIFPRIDITTARIKEFGGMRHAFCSDACEFIFDEDPQRYLGYKTFYELYEGYSLEDYIIETGSLRADGKTLLAQPSLDDTKLWTLNDIRALNYEIKNPLNDVNSDWVR